MSDCNVVLSSFPHITMYVLYKNAVLWLFLTSQFGCVRLVQYCTVLYCTVLYYDCSWHPILGVSVLSYTVLLCTVLYCRISHRTLEQSSDRLAVSQKSSCGMNRKQTSDETPHSHHKGPPSDVAVNLGSSPAWRVWQLSYTDYSTVYGTVIAAYQLPLPLYFTVLYCVQHYTVYHNTVLHWTVVL